MESSNLKPLLIKTSIFVGIFAAALIVLFLLPGKLYADTVDDEASQIEETAEEVVVNTDSDEATDDAENPDGTEEVVSSDEDEYMDEEPISEAIIEDSDDVADVVDTDDADIDENVTDLDNDAESTSSSVGENPDDVKDEDNYNLDDESSLDADVEENIDLDEDEDFDVIDEDDEATLEDNEKVGPTIATDKEDYKPGETVMVTGQGYEADKELEIRIIRPDGSVVKGDGSFEEGSDVIITDKGGNIEYSYKLNGIEGKFIIEVVDTQSGEILSTHTFTDSFPQTVYVDADTGDDDNDGTEEEPFKTIQKGIVTVADEGTVNVAAGTYEENLASWKDMEITKSLNLIGAGSGQTIVELTEDKMNGVEIRGTNYNRDFSRSKYGS